MGFTLGELLKEVYAELGQLQVNEATGGGTDYVTDSRLAGSGGKDNVWNDGTLLILSANGEAPEGEFKRVKAYDDVSGTITATSNFSAQPASGDVYGLTSGYYPVQTLVTLVNAGLRGLGDIPLMDTATLDTAAGQTEYAASVTWKRRPPIKIDVQGRTGDGDDHRWQRVYDWEFVPDQPGQTGLIVFQGELPAGRDLRIWYMDAHPSLVVYSDVVAEVIAPALAIAAGVERALRWQTSRLGGGDRFLLQRWNDAKIELDRARALYPIWKPKRQGEMKISGLKN